MSFSATISNSGGDSGVSSQAGLRLDLGADGTFDMVFAPQATSPLAGGTGQVVTWTDPWGGQIGTHRFEVCADQAAEIAETSEDNNCTTGELTVADVPAAGITVGVQAVPAVLQEPGGTFQIQIAVHNDSSVDAVSIDSLVDQAIGDLDGVGTCDVPQTITPAADLACSFPVIFTGTAGDSQTHVVQAQGTDDDGAAVEGSAEATISIIVPPPPPDYLAESPATTPPAPLEGQPVSFSATISNSGGDSRVSSQAGLRLDLGADGTFDMVFAPQATSPLAGGTGQVVTWTDPWGGQIGTHRFEVCADQAAEIAETSEDNNCTTGEFTVSRPICSQVIGFSQTRRWFLDMEVQEAVDNATWELLEHSGADISTWADPNHPNWSDPIQSPCATRSSGPDRVILTITGEVTTEWSIEIAQAIAAIRIHYPNVLSIRLQPVIGGPAHQVCPWNVTDLVRASFNHPVIHDAILTLVGGDVSMGADPMVRDCSEYRDPKGHLTGPGYEYQGQAIGGFYTSGL